MKSHLYIALVLGFVIWLGALLSRMHGWYFGYWYTDIILHLISGVMFGYTWLWLTHTSRFSPRWFFYFGAIMFGVFGSFLWEIWEFAGWQLHPQDAVYYVPNIGDALGDMGCGLFGAFCVSLWASVVHPKELEPGTV